MALCPLDCDDSFDECNMPNLLDFEGRPSRKKLKNDIERQASTGTSMVAVGSDYSSNWRDLHESVKDIHIHALEKRYLSDVIFIVGEQKVSFSAHRMMLALGSPVFEAMFFGSLAEKGSTVTIPDVDPKGFKCLLRFLYNDDLDIENDVIAFKTFFAADKYCVEMLKTQCELYLSRCRLRASNIWVFFESSLYLNSTAIMDRCNIFLRKYTKAALEDNSFVDVTPRTLESFLYIDTMNVSEMRLLLHLVRWAEHKSESEDDPVEAFRNYLMPMLKLVRFYNLTHQEFVLFLEMPKLKDVLSDSDALAILKFIIKPTVCSPPDWCCKKVRNIISTPEAASSSCPNNEKQDDSSQKQNRNKRKRVKPQKIRVFPSSVSAPSSSDSSDSSENIAISIRSSAFNSPPRLSSDDYV